MDKKLSIILPIYNQADQIQKLTELYGMLAQKHPFISEIIFSINGNDKKSHKACESISNPIFKYAFSEKGGWGLGVKNGIEISSSPWILYTNSARTHLTDLQTVLENFNFSENTIYKGNRKQRSVIRGISSKLLNLEFSILAGRREKDVNGTPKILEKKLFEDLKIESSDDFFDAELIYKSGNIKSKFKNIEIFNSNRIGGKSTTNLKTAIRFYFLLPLKYFQWKTKK